MASALDDLLVHHLHHCPLHQIPPDESVNTIIRRINATIGWQDVTKSIISHYLQARTLAPLILFDFAKCFGDWVGYSIVRFEDSRNKIAYLAYLAVPEMLHGMGVGSAILQHTVEKVVQLGCRRLKICSVTPSVPFYLSFAAKHGIRVRGAEGFKENWAQKGLWNLYYQLGNSTQ